MEPSENFSRWQGVGLHVYHVEVELEGGSVSRGATVLQVRVTPAGETEAACYPPGLELAHSSPMDKQLETFPDGLHHGPKGIFSILV